MYEVICGALRLWGRFWRGLFVASAFGAVSRRFPLLENNWQNILLSLRTSIDAFALHQPPNIAFRCFRQICDSLLTIKSYARSFIMFRIWYGALQQLIYQHLGHQSQSVAVHHQFLCSFKKYWSQELESIYIPIDWHVASQIASSLLYSFTTFWSYHNSSRIACLLLV